MLSPPRSPPPIDPISAPDWLELCPALRIAATSECRFYIGSIGGDAQRFAWAVRNHWGIENRLHWCLDIAFREDESRVRDR